MSIAKRYKDILDSQGVSVTYKRVTSQATNSSTLEKANTTTDETITVHFRKSAYKTVSGLVNEGERQMRISADSISFVPKANDLVVTSNGTMKVVSVDPRTANGLDAVYICVVRGDG